MPFNIIKTNLATEHFLFSQIIIRKTILKCFLVFFILLVLNPSSSATNPKIFYSSSDDTIYIGDNVVTNISNVYNTISNSNVLQQISPKQWYLNSNLYINKTATLYFNSTDAAWLKINSTGTDIHYIIVEGAMEGDSVTITGWDSSSNNNRTIPTSSTKRSYIKVTGTANISNSRIGWLGYWGGDAANGLALIGPRSSTVQSSIITDSFDGVLIQGSNKNVINNKIINNYVGVEIYTNNAYNNVIDNNSFASNLAYGVYLQAAWNPNNITNNTFYSESTAIRVYSTGKTNVKGNNINGTGQWGILVFDSSETIIDSNIIKGTLRDGININGGSAGSSLNCIIKNNIVMNSGWQALAIGTGGSDFVTNNEFMGSGINYPLVLNNYDNSIYKNNKYITTNYETAFSNINGKNVSFVNESIDHIVTLPTTINTVTLLINEYDKLSNIYDFKISSNIAENPTNIKFQTSTINTQFGIKRKGIIFDTTNSNATGWINYKYENINGVEWPESSFDFRFEPKTQDFFLKNISGYVKSSNGSGVYSASVSNDITSEIVSTDATGYYKFSVPANTSVTVQAQKSGYFANSTSAKVGLTDVSNVNIVLANGAIPPASIKTLQNTTYEQTYISWSWADPADAVFSKVMIYLNGIFKTNVTKGFQFYSATGLTPNTTYIISTHTVDISGNVNQTWVNHTARTAPVSILDLTPPIVTILSPGSTQYSTNVIPLTYYANEPITDCYISLDGTSNQTSPTCANVSVINREYAQNSNTAAWWHFNENSGNALQDFSGNANTGIINGASWVAGKFGSGLKFDGKNSYVEIPDANVLDGDNQISIEAWVKPILGTDGSIVSKFVYGSANDRVYELEILSDGKIDFGLSSDGTSPGTKWLQSNNLVTNNVWNHIVATSDGLTMKIYINGVLDPNTISAPSIIHTSPYNLQIGAWKYDPSGATDTYFNGVIDEVRLLGKALTNDEIMADYALGNGSHNITIYAKDNSGNWNSTTRDFGINLGTFLPEDINKDSLVNKTDLDIVWDSINTNTFCQLCDLDNNEKIELYDWILVSIKI